MSSTQLGTVIVRESFKFPNSIRSCPEFNAVKPVTFAWMMAGNMSRHRSVLLSSNLKPEQFRMTGPDFQVNSKSMAIKCLIIVLTHSSQKQQCMSTTISSAHCGSYPIMPHHDSFQGNSLPTSARCDAMVQKYISYAGVVMKSISSEKFSTSR